MHLHRVPRPTREMIRDKLREEYEHYSIKKAFLLNTIIRLYGIFSGNVGNDA